jgi:peptidoglycan/xylan/chitin deacetylase (PgdA/CDA1 family)
LNNLLDSIKNGNLLPKHAFLLTFDDGFREINDIVAPILQKKGIPATFFINTAFIDNKELCYQHKASILIEHIKRINSYSFEKKIKEIFKKNNISFANISDCILLIKYQQKKVIDEIAKLLDIDFNDYLIKNKPYLTTYQIKKLIKSGFTIGAHSIDHPLYYMLSLKDQIYQTIESIKEIRNKFGLGYGAFAFPHTDEKISKSFFLKINNTGLVDVTFGTGGIKKDSLLFHYQRFSLEKPLIPAKKIIALQFARKIFRILQGKDKTIRY